jgi:hypothetical protein
MISDPRYVAVAGRKWKETTALENQGMDGTNRLAKLPGREKLHNHEEGTHA